MGIEKVWCSTKVSLLFEMSIGMMKLRTEEQPLLSVSLKSTFQTLMAHCLLFSCSISGLVIVLYSAVCMETDRKDVFGFG